MTRATNVSLPTCRRRLLWHVLWTCRARRVADVIYDTSYERVGPDVSPTSDRTRATNVFDPTCPRRRVEQVLRTCHTMHLAAKYVLRTHLTKYFSKSWSSRIPGTCFVEFVTVIRHVIRRWWVACKSVMHRPICAIHVGLKLYMCKVQPIRVIARYAA